MKFNKFNAKKYGRRGGLAAAAKRRSERQSIAALAAAMETMKRERDAFAAFSAADRGTFDGFTMAAEFHRYYCSANALRVAESDDKGDALGVHVGADGVTVYFFCDPENAKKQVRFNKSVYIF